MGLLTPLAIRIGAQPWMPKFLPQVVAVDQRLQKLSRGRLSLLDIAGLPNVLLTATGRKSGQARTTPLLCVPDGERILVAGSYFGGPKEPLWVKNIEANPGVTVRFKRRTSRRVARRISDDDRPAAWAKMLRVWPNFALYEQRTTRQIKLFELVVPSD
jgi:deazaflavin-dependent oxidoreductase (nitroreductase family)